MHDKNDNIISVIATDSYGEIGSWTFDRTNFDDSTCVVKKVKTGEVSDTESNSPNLVLFGSIVAGFAFMFYAGVWVLIKVREDKLSD